MENKAAVIAHVAIVFFAMAFLFVGNRWVRGAYSDDDGETMQVYRARVTGITARHAHSMGGESWYAYTFAAEITRGARRGEAVSFTQSTRGHFFEQMPRVAREGDRVILGRAAPGGWNFLNYVRINRILILGAVFMGLVLVFGRLKGFNALLALGLTAGAVFLVFIPAILAGHNIYLAAILVSAYTVLVTLFIINGVSKKTAAAIAGCLGGVVAAGLLTFFMNSALLLTGTTQTESNILRHVTDPPMNLNAIIFAGIIIGAVGAIMDMAVSISSALWEIKAQQPESGFAALFKSGVQIGKDILGSNINTLVLAYIGSSLTIILIFMSQDVSLHLLMNREGIIVEFLMAIVGSFGIFLTMPLTAAACAALYTHQKEEVIEVHSPFD